MEKIKFNQVFSEKENIQKTECLKYYFCGTL